MAEYKVIWSTRSLEDLIRAHELLSEQSSETANLKIEAILNRVTQLERFPESGPIESSLSHQNKAYRYLVEGHHKLIYRIEERAVFIVRVFDTRQNPDRLK